MSPDRQSHVREGVGTCDVGTDSVVYPAVSSPVTETAVVCHPRDKHVESLRLRLRLRLSEYSCSPGRGVRQLPVTLGETHRQLLQDGAGGAAPGRVAVTGARQAGATQGTVQLGLTTLTGV